MGDNHWRKAGCSIGCADGGEYHEGARSWARSNTKATTASW